jgi:hypothetical protein
VAIKLVQALLHQCQASTELGQLCHNVSSSEVPVLRRLLSSHESAVVHVNFSCPVSVLL